MSSRGFFHSSVSKEAICNAGGPGSIPGSGRSPRKGNDNRLHYSCLGNPMDRGAWQATVHGVARVRHDWATKPPLLMSSKSIHVVSNGEISFLFLWINNVTLCIWILHFIHPFIDILATVNNIAGNIRLFFLTNFCLFEFVLSFPMDKYPEVELWDYVIVLFLIFWGNSILFSILAISTYVPTNSVQGFLLLHILANTCHFLSFWW